MATAPLRLLLALLAVLLPMLLLHMLVPHSRVGSPLRAGALNLLGALLALACYRLYVRYVEARPAQELSGAGATQETLRGVALGAAMFGVTVGGLALLGVFQISGHQHAGVLLAPAVLSIAAALLEELLFRAVLFRLLEQALGSGLALLLSAALFGGAHLANPNATLVSAAAIMLEAGVMLGAAFMLTRRLWLPIGIHFAWNFTQGGIFGIAVSGLASNGLLLGTLEGPRWLSGGRFGAEASVVAVLVCGAVGVGLLARAIRHGQLVRLRDAGIARLLRPREALSP